MIRRLLGGRPALATQADVVRSDARMRAAWSYDETVARRQGGTLYDVALCRYALVDERSQTVALYDVAEHDDGRRVVYQWRVDGTRFAVTWTDLPRVVAALLRDAPAAALLGALYVGPSGEVIQP